MSIIYKAASFTDAGTRKDDNGNDHTQKNEDSSLFKAFEPKEKGMFVGLVADGVGGLAHGEIASNFITESFDEWLEKNWEAIYEMDVGDFEKAVYDEVMKINDDICVIAENKRLQMGSTLVFAAILGDKYVIFHSGDSRCYLKQGKRFNQLTEDQTLAEAERTLGKEETLRKYPSSAGMSDEKKEHTLLYSLGMKGCIPLVYDGMLLDNYKLLVCSDGLCNRLSNEDINGILIKDGSAKGKIRELAELARTRGEGDNITAILIEKVTE